MVEMRRDMERLDIAIIGSGPAGISAAITSKIRNKNILLIGNTIISEKVLKAQEILNYPGVPKTTGKDLAQIFESQLRELQIETASTRVNTIYAMGDYFVLQAGNMTYEAKAVILASGVQMDKPLPGEKEFLGRGVSYCATCDAQFYKGKDVAVFGYNHEAVDEAAYLAEFAAKVYYYPMGKEKVYLPDYLILAEERPLEILGDMKVKQIKTDQSLHNIDGVFILRDSVMPDQLVPGLHMEEGHVQVNLQMETNIPGLFACGDITGKPYQYIKAAGQGNTAALSAVSYLHKL